MARHKSQKIYSTKSTDENAQALIFQMESGADVIIHEEDFSKKPKAKLADKTSATQAVKETAPQVDAKSKPKSSSVWADKAREAAMACETLEDLKQAIADFDGLEVKNTATNMVFCDGNVKSRVMVIGEAPGADEDEQGKPFVGRSGRLLDLVLLSAGLSRKEDDPKKSLYISNVLNWRPPGNRTPTPQEMTIARPFIEKHIALQKPDIILCAGAVAIQTLIEGAPTLSKARNKWHNYKPQTSGIELDKKIELYALYHPAYLMRSPLQKKKAWHDMIKVMEKIEKS